MIFNVGDPLAAPSRPSRAPIVSGPVSPHGAEVDIRMHQLGNYDGISHGDIRPYRAVHLYPPQTGFEVLATC